MVVWGGLDGSLGRSNDVQSSVIAPWWSSEVLPGGGGNGGVVVVVVVVLGVGRGVRGLSFVLKLCHTHTYTNHCVFTGHIGRKIGG